MPEVFSTDCAGCLQFMLDHHYLCEQAECNVGELFPAQPQALGYATCLCCPGCHITCIAGLLLGAVSICGKVTQEMDVMQARSLPLQLWHTTEQVGAMLPHPTKA